MKKIKIFLFSLSFLVMSSCTQTSKDEIVNENLSDLKYILENRFYFQDKETNLCFFARRILYNNSTLTNVPCTKEVLNLIINKDVRK